MIQEQKESLIEGQFVYVFALILALIWGKRRREGFRKRMERQRKVSSSDVDDKKIIVALEIDNLFLKYSDRKRLGYTSLEKQFSNQSQIQKLKGLFGYGEFYCLLQQQSKIRAFLKSLSTQESIEMYLYTSLNKDFASKILKKLSIEHYFPENRRKYCQDQDIKLKHKKHPAWVDTNTRRVMIVTANKSDLDQEDKKYFLYLNRLNHQKILKSAYRIIKHIVKHVHSVDELHLIMDEVKAQIQTDHQNQDIFTV